MKLINKISLKFGPNGFASKLELSPTGITLFVGPNNSGKSLVLREIEKCCATNNKSGNLILDDISYTIPDKDKIIKDLKLNETEPNKNEIVPDGSIVVHRINSYQGLKQREIVPLNQISHWVETNNVGAIARYYISLLTARLDGATRTTLLKPAPRGDLLASPTNILAALFIDSESREKIRNLTYEAFGSYFTIDALNGNNLRARLAERPPLDEAEEQALDKRAREYHKHSFDITEASDGVKAFTGMIATLLGQNCKVPLIDEPEAFLHPPLARRLGKELAEISSKYDATSFIATHSADFLMGCISGNSKVNIIRLTYKGDKPTARLLHFERLQNIIKSPLMRSTGVLSALFHEGAVVCEGDSDRALYQEINDRISASENYGYAEALFINAHSKQSTAKIAGPLREMGIPAAVVVDFDVFKPDGDFKRFINDLGIPSTLASGWFQTKSLIAKYCSENDIDWKRSGLEDIKDNGVLLSTKTLINNLKEFGIFVVPNGELESWLADLEIENTQNKKLWLLNVFDRLGGDPDVEGYIKPQGNDIWQFLREIAHWINNPTRSGL